VTLAISAPGHRVPPGRPPTSAAGSVSAHRHRRPGSGGVAHGESYGPCTGSPQGHRHAWCVKAVVPGRRRHVDRSCPRRLPQWMAQAWPPTPRGCRRSRPPADPALAPPAEAQQGIYTGSATTCPSPRTNKGPARSTCRLDHPPESSPSSTSRTTSCCRWRVKSSPPSPPAAAQGHRRPESAGDVGVEWCGPGFAAQASGRSSR